MLCQGLPAFIEKDITFFDAQYLEEANYPHLLENMLTRYQTYYSDYMKNNFTQHVSFSTIITDRAMQNLDVNNPFSIEKMLTKEMTVKFYKLISGGHFTANTGSGKFGGFNQHVLCLLYLNIVSRLESNGSLIFDTQFLTSQHIDLLNEFFNMNGVPWDYNNEDNRELRYEDCYMHGRHGAPQFMIFSFFNGHELDFTAIQNRFMQLSFPNLWYREEDSNLHGVAPTST